MRLCTADKGMRACVGGRRARRNMALVGDGGDLLILDISVNGKRVSYQL